MTRRGSLAYYLAAWICGCFFMSVAVWLKDLGNQPVQLISPTGAVGLLFFCFYGLLLGVVPALLAAFILRRLMSLAGWEQGWQWAFAGAILAPLLIGVLGAWWRHVTWPSETGPRWLSLLAYGPAVVLDAGLWLAIPAGAATAFVLSCIHRAFSHRTEPSPVIRG